MTKFILDVHLGKLARLLRMLGFDCLFDSGFEDERIAELSVGEERVVLTRDRGLLLERVIFRGYWVENIEPTLQLVEVLDEFDLRSDVKPFTRCMECNGLLRVVPKEDVLSELPPKTRDYFDLFYQCEDCGHVYWEGSHYENMKEFIESLE